jgi:limonene 1,2-monooxygenase
MRFGAFLPPHHPVGEHPTLLIERDLQLVAHLDHLGYDEFWVGEHHSSGWEMIASPELFLAAAGERTRRIKLGTGVVSLPYHHPFTVAQRMVQLDHMTRGRVIFGTGPGALTQDAQMLGIDTMVLRDRQDEAVGILKRLLAGEEVTYECEWFKLHKANLQLLPFQEHMEMVTASSVSPSGMKLAGKYGMGVLSLATSFAAGMYALTSQWAFAEQAARESGNHVSRDRWRILLNFHLAENRRQAEQEAALGYQHWHNDYIIGTLTADGKGRVEDPWDLIERAREPAFGATRTITIGTPDEAVKTIRNLYEATGGFGCVLGLAHDWAGVEATRRSWELFARYVIPEINGLAAGLKTAFDLNTANRAELLGRQFAAIQAKMGDRKIGQMKAPVGGQPK